MCQAPHSHLPKDWEDRGHQIPRRRQLLTTPSQQVPSLGPSPGRPRESLGNPSTLWGWAGGPLPAASLPGAGLCPNWGSPISSALGYRGTVLKDRCGLAWGHSLAACPCSRPAQGSTAQSLFLASSCPERSQSCAAGAAVSSITQPGWATRRVALAPATPWVASHFGGATAAIAVASHTPMPLLPGPSGLPQCRPSSRLRETRPCARTQPLHPFCLSGLSPRAAPQETPEPCRDGPSWWPRADSLAHVSQQTELGMAPAVVV